MEYTTKDLATLEGIEAVRVRPGMYIGGTGSRGMHHLVWEIMDNSIDELANGHGDMLTVELFDDNVIEVSDNGRGMPVDVDKKQKISGVEIIFTKLHAGGKFGGGAYKFSGGLHGVGAAVTNALSEWLEVRVYRDGWEHFIRFRAIQQGKQIKSGIAEGKLERTVPSLNVGSRVKFKPDPRVFKDEKFSFDIIHDKMRMLSYLNKDIHFKLIDSRSVLQGGKGKTIDFYSTKGIADYLVKMNTGKTVLFDKPIYIEVRHDDFELYAAIQYLEDSYSEQIYSYVNNVHTSDGGTHEVGFRTAITKTFNNFARKNNLLKEKQANLTGDDYREGMVAIISIKMGNPEFDGQTKTKLGNPEIKTKVESILSEKLDEILSGKANRQSFDKILNKAMGAAKTREAASRARDISRKQNKLASMKLLGKLMACRGKDATKNELFIVEGNSAGGSAKDARDSLFQAILPLRGKPLNVEKAKMDKILANEELKTIIAALGTGIQRDFDISGLKYDKIIILSDADQDGGHIRSLLLAFFYRKMRPLIEQGHIFIGMPPLYKVETSKKSIYCYDDEALEVARKKLGKGLKLQRFKGLGEMNPSQLWETTMDPANRKLIKVGIEDVMAAEERMTILMGDDSKVRKDYINEHANFNKVDNFKLQTSPEEVKED